jgi:GT2 family glycosyltransferase
MDDPRARIFDPAWYLESYPDVRAAGTDPLVHYLIYGLVESRTPNPLFDPLWYLARYPDVDGLAMEPALHYALRGGHEGRAPHRRFDPAYYATQLAAAGMETDNPLAHWLATGRAAGLSPVPPAAWPYLPSGQKAPAAPPGLSVDVIVPVHNAAAVTRRCLDSLFADPTRPPGEIIVVDDGSTDAELVAELDALGESRRIRLLRHPRALGFTASANLAIEATERDVVLLNSDTEVPAGWLDRLAGHAHASPWIGSVTPFSNNASICSYPAITGRTIAFGRGLAEVDAACRAVNGGRRVDLPTGVGFCLYLRRDCIQQTGPLDAETFGAGYGEENDFCLRASRHGWRHVLACDTFVYHQGSASFGPGMAPLFRRNQKLLNTRYIYYQDQVTAHIKQDPAGPARWAVTARLFRDAGPTLLTIGGAGLAGGGVVRLDETAAEIAVSVPGPTGHPVARFPADATDSVAEWLRTFDIGAIRRADWRPAGPAAQRIARALGQAIGHMVPGTAQARIEGIREAILPADQAKPATTKVAAEPAPSVSGESGASPSAPSRSRPRPPPRSPRRRVSSRPAG